MEDVIFRPGSKAAHWWSTLNESVNLKEFSALSNETDQVLYCQSLANFDQLPLASDVKPKNHDEAMKLKDEGNKYSLFVYIKKTKAFIRSNLGPTRRASITRPSTCTPWPWPRCHLTKRT